MELFIITLAYILGVIMGLYFKIGIALIVVIVFFIYIFKKKNRYLKLIYKKEYVILFLCVFIISSFNIIGLEKKYKEKYEVIGSNTKVDGTIISNPLSKQHKTNFTLKVESINNDKSFKNTKLKVNVKNNKQEYKYGDKISLNGDFVFAEERRNTGGFDYREYLKTKGIYGVMIADGNSINLVKERNFNFIFISANNLAIKIKENINKIFNNEEASILTGILLGDKENMEEEIKDAFRKSNLSHMLAVSGLHVSYVVMLIGFIISKSKIGKRLGKIITIILLLFFILLTGGTLSVSRACIMSIYMIIASMLHTRVNVYSSINISLLILLIINPYCIFDVGLQLSYGGTLGIVLIYNIINDLFSNKKKQEDTTDKKNRILKLITKIKEIILVSISANIFIIPIMAYHYNTISLTFIFSNLLASPIIGILIVLGLLIAFITFLFTPLSKLLKIPLNILLHVFLGIANNIGSIPCSIIYVPTPKLYMIFIYYLTLIVIISLKKISKKTLKRRYEKRILKKLRFFNFKRIISLVLIISLVFTFIKHIPNSLRIYFIDVGQGDSTLVVTPYGKSILIDGGGSSNSEFDIGKNTLIPYLLDRGLTKIDFIIISHFDTDHVGGLLTVMEELKVGKVIISRQGENSENYQRFKEIVKEKRINMQVVNKGDRLQIEKNLYFDILWPNNQNLISENILNNNSIVCKLIYKNFSFIFTGDIEEIAEKQILEEYKESLKLLKSTILKVAHHGSKTSSTQEFIEAVKPKTALIGVGENNKFGHPNDEVIERLQSLRYKNISNRPNGRNSNYSK